MCLGLICSDKEISGSCSPNRRESMKLGFEQARLDAEFGRITRATEMRGRAGGLLERPNFLQYTFRNSPCIRKQGDLEQAKRD